MLDTLNQNQNIMKNMTYHIGQTQNNMSNIYEQENIPPTYYQEANSTTLTNNGMYDIVKKLQDELRTLKIQITNSPPPLIPYQPPPF